jgi:outer membrane protein OmpA-like peptidoglycan-associated protein
MKQLLAVASLSALVVQTAYAQQSSEPATTAFSGQTEPEKFLVLFDMDEATLSPDATRAINEAAEEYHRTGAARVIVTGYTDTTGAAAYNLELSRRRAEAVSNALVRAWVPATDITATGRGEEDLPLPTVDGVPEPRNRRVEIVVPQPPPPAPVAKAAPPGQTGPEKFLVLFDMDEATLTPDATAAVNDAAEEYHRTGAARIVVTGYTDSSGSAAYNQELSRRRAEVVANELVRAWVPATDITAVGRGENDLLLPTPDGVPEPRNRRVEIVVPQPPPPAPVAEAAAAPTGPTVSTPEEVEPAAPPEEEPGAFAFTLGPIYGHNFGEADDGGENDLAGAQLTFNVLPGFLGGVALKQGLLWSFNGDDDGFTGRSVAALGLAPDLGIVRPILAANFGGVYGKGVQDGLVAGPEIGLDITLLEGFAMRAFVAYDYQFRNPGGWDEGVLWGGLNFGVSF